MARRTKPIVQPEPLRIPSPDHAAVTITLCGNEHTYEEPRSRLEHDKLLGLFLLASVKMGATMDAGFLQQYAARMAQAEDVEGEAQRVQQEIGALNASLFGCGALLAIEDVYNAVCAGLRLTPGARAFLQDNYDKAELFAAYQILLGLIQRPFGGTRNATKQRGPIQMD